MRPGNFSGNGEVRKAGATKRSASAPVFRHPKTELEAAIQRYVDLFDFAPIAYVSFDRVGRIEEINLAAAQLLGGSRDSIDRRAICASRDERRRRALSESSASLSLFDTVASKPNCI